MNSPVAYIDASELGARLDNIERLQRMHLKFVTEIYMITKEALDKLVADVHSHFGVIDAVVSHTQDQVEAIADLKAKYELAAATLQEVQAATAKLTAVLPTTEPAPVASEPPAA